jgi:hypothetical protein
LIRRDRDRLAVVPELTGARIRHTVVFTPRHEPGSPEEEDLVAAGAALASIAGVEAFEVLREISPKNSYRLGFSMEFADEAAYVSYNEDPRHVAFVQTRWIPEVVDFLEIDYRAHGSEQASRGVRA